ncbi:MAG: hypothetical protein AAF587_17705 [Bacteroidota bacterium]
MIILLDSALEFLQNKEISSALIATLTTIVVLFGKEFMDNRRAKKQEQKEQFDTFKIYGSPLLLAAESLIFRLKEIFDHGSTFLHEDGFQIEYYRYRYISTLYRLCAVLGWLAIFKRELVNLDLKGKKANEEIDKAIDAFEGALASNNIGQDSLLQYLAKKWKVNLDKLTAKERREVEQQIEFSINAHLAKVENKEEGEKTEITEWIKKLKKQKENISLELDPRRPLPVGLQMEILRIAASVITEKMNTESIPEERLEAHRSKCILCLSRKVSWIYRDWQKAIGNLMYDHAGNEYAEGRFHIMSFRKFEEEYLAYKDKPEDHRWLRRVDRLLVNLDVLRDDKVDARIQQLKNVLSGSIQLFVAIQDRGIGTAIISNKKLDELKKFDKTNNESWYTSQKKESIS